MIKKMLLLAVLAALAVSLFGCNTVSGMGQDIKSASKTVKGWFTNP